MPREPEESFDLQLAQDLLDIVPRVVRHFRKEMRAMAKPQLTIAQLRILAKLYRGVFTITELSDWQGVSAPAMSKMVGILETRGLARRSTQSSDRRQVTVNLTDEGRKVFLSIRKAVRIKIADQIRPLPDAKKRILSEALQTLGEIYD